MRREIRFVHLQRVQLFSEVRLTEVYRITRIARQTNDVSVTWLSPAGWTNVIQTANDLASGFSDCSPSIIATGSGIVTTNFLHTGGAANHPSRYYRIRLGP